jgi:hypothetical protein
VLCCGLPLAEAGLQPRLELWELKSASETESDRRLMAATPQGITTTGGACTGSCMYGLPTAKGLWLGSCRVKACAQQQQ